MKGRSFEANKFSLLALHFGCNSYFFGPLSFPAHAHIPIASDYTFASRCNDIGCSQSALRVQCRVNWAGEMRDQECKYHEMCRRARLNTAFPRDQYVPTHCATICVCVSGCQGRGVGVFVASVCVSRQLASQSENCEYCIQL